MEAAGLRKNYPMIHETLITAARGTQPPPTSAERPAQKSAAAPKADAPAAKVELSAYAKARAREATQTKEKTLNRAPERGPSPLIRR